MRADCLKLSRGRRIAYCRSHGSSDPGIVFLGGFGSDMEGTKALRLERWAAKRGRSFLRFDYTGHGQSSGRFEDGCIGDWSADAFDAIQKLTSGPQLLVGSSMGGWIALLLARRCPEKIMALVGIAAAPDFTDDFERNRLTQEQLREVTDTGKVELPSEYSDQPMVVTRKLLQDGPRNFVLNAPLCLPFPVRFLQGTADEDVEQSTAIRLLNHAEGPDMRLVMVKDADHRFSNERCLKLIEDTVASLLATAPEIDGI